MKKQIDLEKVEISLQFDCIMYIIFSKNLMCLNLHMLTLLGKIRIIETVVLSAIL